MPLSSVKLVTFQSLRGASARAGADEASPRANRAGSEAFARKNLKIINCL
ncbi:hypothetical protein GCM10010836_46520 [Aminobacter aminovorans]